MPYSLNKKGFIGLLFLIIAVAIGFALIYNLFTSIFLEQASTFKNITSGTSGKETQVDTSVNQLDAVEKNYRKQVDAITQNRVDELDNLGKQLNSQ